jgi:23S rRNA (cytidine1920-2'-O)/16S rRNA (cytidine1409-2'-O)-methyltransferase
MRIDQWLVQHGLCESREKAKLEVEHQRVTINGKVVPKTSVQVSETDVVLLGDPYLKYVSKGGMKLEKALEEFMIDLTGLQVLDIGASTGGFTDCALKHGAARVVAMDVGSNQLHSSLQNHPQVLQMEQTDIREVTPDAFDTLFDVVLVDVSFISLDFVFPCLSALIKPDGRILTLIKPQFEQKERVRFRNGIIKDERVHRRVLDSSIKCAEQNGLRLVKQTTTDIGNEQKNLEFLALWKKAI